MTLPERRLTKSHASYNQAGVDSLKVARAIGVDGGGGLEKLAQQVWARVACVTDPTPRATGSSVH